jgi:hypothetical protein
MGLDNLIKKNHHHKTSHHDHDEHHYEGPHDRYDHNDDHNFRNGGYHYHGGHHGHFKLELVRSMIKSLPHKKALLAGALIIFIIMIITGIALLWAVSPLITQAVGYAEANGIKGIVDSVLPYVDKLWKGNG